MAGSADDGVARASSRRVVDRLGDDEVGRRLDHGWVPLSGRLAGLDRKRCRLGECPQRGGEAGLGQNRRVNAVGKLAELAQRGLGIAGRLREERSGLDVALGLCTCTCDPEIV